METPFASATKQRDFWLFYLATFACFFTISQTAMLSVLLRDVHMSDQTAGVILGARYITAIVGTLYSATFVARIGVLNTAMLGIAVMVLSFLGLQVTYTEPAPAFAMRLLAGAGFGIFFPASFLFVRKCVTESCQIQYMAILQTALVIPNLFGPGVAEWYLHHFGSERFFVVMGLPPLLVTLIVWLLARGPTEVSKASTNSYIGLLGRREISVPLAASLVVGMVQTFAVVIDASLASMLGSLVSWVGTDNLAGEILSIPVSRVGPLLPYALMVLMLVLSPRGLMGTRDT